MQIGAHRFDRLEFAGSLGDLGTLIPLSIALVTVNRLSFSSVFLMIGLFYILTGAYYRLPIPVQPLKVVSAIAIAYPETVTLPVIAATGILFGVTLLALAISGFIDQIARFFTKPVIRGIQLGLGFILMRKGVDLILQAQLFVHHNGPEKLLGFSINLIIGILAMIVVLLLLSSKRFPAALVIVGLGSLAGCLLGGLEIEQWQFGPTPMALSQPSYPDFINAFFLLLIPQIPLTIGNAVIGTTDTARQLFGRYAADRVTNRRMALSMGLINLVVGALAAMPMCHGAGGLAAHYRFGARTGGSNLMIGMVFVAIALLLGKIGISLLSAIPNAILGVLLLFAGLELALIVRDLQDKQDFFVAFLIAGIALATTNMGIAFAAGILISYIIKWARVQI